MKIAGAGVVIIETYKGYPVITLFGKKGGEFSDPGGTVDGGERPEHTAYRELREETANLLNIEPEQLEAIGIPYEYNRYLFYLIHVSGLSEKDYNYNVKKVAKCGRVWRETNKMIRIDLSDLFEMIKKGEKSVIDLKGKTYRIRQRTIAIIKDAKRDIKKLAKADPQKLVRHKVKKSRYDCLINTFTYRLKSVSEPMLPFTQSYRYGIYIVPNVTFRSPYDLQLCNQTGDGIYIILAGISKHQPVNIDSYLQHISNSGSTPWKINVNTFFFHQDGIYFSSKTLDSISDFLAVNNFKSIKGPHLTRQPWLINLSCHVKNPKLLFKSLTWSLALVKSDGGVRLVKRYLLTTM